MHRPRRLQAKAKRQGAEAKQQSALQRSIDAELDWVNSKAKGQQKKGKARMRRYDELCAQVGLPAPSALGACAHALLRIVMHRNGTICCVPV